MTGSERMVCAVTHLGVRERIPKAIAHLTTFWEPDEDPIHLEGTVGMCPTSHMTAGLLQVGLAVGFLATSL